MPINAMQDMALDTLCFLTLFSIPVVLGIGARIFFDSLLRIVHKT